MAANLPIELIYCILDYLDVEDYIAVRSTCRKWRIAASASSIIRNILQQVPVSLPPRTELLANKEWNAYFTQVVRHNLLGYHTGIQKTESRCELPQECSHCTIYDTSRDGRKLVVLKGARALLYSRPGVHCPWELVRSAPLYSLWTSVCTAVLGGGIGGLSQHAKHHIALSSSGHLLAVGLDKTIQIYSLLGDSDGLSSPAQYTLNQEDSFVNPVPTSYEETNGMIESLEFADEDDTLLRVTIGQETTTYQPTRVRYLGNPARNQTPSSASLAYWRANISQVYVDSVSMAATLAGGDGGEKVLLRGLRLLPRSPGNEHCHQPSRKFTALLQIGTKATSGYCIGEVTTTPAFAQGITITRILPSRDNYCPEPDNTLPQITPFTIPITSTSPPSTTTSPASKPNTTTQQTNPTFQTTDAHHKTTTLHSATTSRWNTANLPTAAGTINSPLVTVSPDAKVMCIYEPGSGHYSRIAAGGAVYIYSLMHDDHPQPSSYSSWPHDQTNPTQKYPHISKTTIPTWSLLLDITDEDIQDLRVDSSRGQDEAKEWRYAITAITTSPRQILEWRI
ncbi:F-box protein [Aspergillus homomorphus CBS 101889]|uniref:F-box domain-containing protein n=1 Tax=Aspergillus homomorphus (strain CBS 101889) TaxID=1450537 RepID=A0A395HU92_ASPHC|nr:hypothetical protein BO97DRAFT_406895 [Aspergillus homomorphus CBS 101889]RAL10398.1 hypothetical protein BO97DRAFT_406895 [Aspergillus homomorphus CBS 101889]